MSIKDWLIKKCGGYTDKDIDKLKDDAEFWQRICSEYARFVTQCDALSDKILGIAPTRHFALVKGAPADTKLPTRKTKGSAGYDFYLPCDVVLEPYGDSPIIQTGVKAYMPEDEVLLLFIRSSVGIMKNVTLSNSVAVIDASYCDNPDNEGNIGLKLHNNSPHTVTFKKGERIMQGVFVKYGVVDDDNATEERKGGIGSTGKE